ncbi:14-3-3 protein [Auriculariales sp. MPI-PUGE-AT-0066]|nr:14-3-3 protein [Auriculariales sp. MPI-PUGE-AT-0066]
MQTSASHFFPSRHYNSRFTLTRYAALRSRKRSGHVSNVARGAVYLCSAAEEAARYEEMVLFVRVLSGYEQEFTVDECCIQEVAGLKRAALRRLSELGNRYQPQDDNQRALLQGMKRGIMKELVDLCDEAIDAIENRLLPRSVLTESITFYHKMTGDYLRYLAEFSAPDSPERTTLAARARIAYDAASSASSNLSPTNPVRLGLALNISVFEFEIIGNIDKAFVTAQRALSEGTVEEALDEMLPEHEKDATLIVQLLRDNLRMWSPKVLSSHEPVDVESDEESIELETKPLVQEINAINAPRLLSVESSPIAA